MRWLVGAMTTLVVGAVVARASAEPGVRVVGIAVDPSVDAPILALVDAMLDAPSEHVDAGAARRTDELVALGFATPAEYVLVIHSQARRVVAIAPAEHRMIERVLPADVVASPYAVASAANELLEALREPSTAIAPTRGTEEEEPPRSPATPEAHEEPTPPASGARFSRHLRLAIGGAYWIGLDAPPQSPELLGSIEAIFLSPAGRFGLVGLVAEGLGRDRTHPTIAGSELHVTYRRADFGVRIGLGRRLGRVDVLGLLEGGISRVSVDAYRTRPGGDRQTGHDARATAYVGAAFGVRLALGRGLSIGWLVGLDVLPWTTTYEALGGIAVDEPHLRARASIDLAFGR